MIGERGAAGQSPARERVGSECVASGNNGQNEEEKIKVKKNTTSFRMKNKKARNKKHSRANHLYAMETRTLIGQCRIMFSQIENYIREISKSGANEFYMDRKYGRKLHGQGPFFKFIL